MKSRKNSKEYKAWLRIKQCCYNPKDKSFNKYGGRGITVCCAWMRSFGSFLLDVGMSPSPKHKFTLHEGSSEFNEENCRWAPPCDIIKCGEHAYVCIEDNRSKCTKLVLVDLEDIGIVAGYPWHFSHKANHQYAYTKVPKNQRVAMHRLINKTPCDMHTDHINGDTLDNRKSNLRSCTPSENSISFLTLSRNKSGFRGVYLHKDTLKWAATITYKGKKMHLGLFNTAQDASIAYKTKRNEVICNEGNTETLGDSL